MPGILLLTALYQVTGASLTGGANHTSEGGKHYA